MRIEHARIVAFGHETYDTRRSAESSMRVEEARIVAFGRETADTLRRALG